MPKPFHISIVAPDHEVVEDTAVSVVAPGATGYFGVQAGHVPFLAALRPGLVEYETQRGERHHIAVSGGFAEVLPDKVVILADAAEKAEEIDLDRAQQQLDRARAALRGENASMTSTEAAATIEKATARIRAAKLGNG